MSRRSKKQQKTALPPPPAALPRGAGRSNRLWILAVSWLITWAAFSNSIWGEFVYDDGIQIVQNSYIQEGRHFWQALSSDVWAFKGEREQAWSNYWRPTFVVWLTLNYRMFGLEPAGWHVANIVLQCLVLALFGLVLRRLNVRPAVAACALWLFAAHPVHTESVAWISGSPDMILAIFLLGSYAAYLSQRDTPRLLTQAAMLVLYAGATLSKEVSILFPGLIFVTQWALINDREVGLGQRFKVSLLVSLPFVAVAVVYLLVRVSVLGMLGESSPWAPSTAGIILSMPEILAFYLRQAFFPMILGPAYPLRAVEPSTLGVLNFYVPAVVSILAVVAGVLIWRRGAVYKIGIALFLLPLAPAMNIAAFLPEQLVHDRYLYLPLMGLTMIIAGLAGELARRRTGKPANRRTGWKVGSADGALYGAGLLLSAGLAVVTARYNRAWLSDIALWECAVRVDPNSAHTQSQLGSFYLRAGRREEARARLARALEIDSGVTSAILDMAKIDQLDGRYAAAEANVRRVLAVFPDHVPAWDLLATTLEAQGKYAEAAEVFVSAREKIPYLGVKYTMNIAIFHKRLGDDERAIAELESIGEQLTQITNPQYLRCYFFLGELYYDAGRREEARTAYKDFLRTTAGATDPTIKSFRTRARQRLEGK